MSLHYRWLAFCVQSHVFCFISMTNYRVINEGKGTGWGLGHTTSKQRKNKQSEHWVRQDTNIPAWGKKIESVQTWGVWDNWNRPLTNDVTNNKYISLAESYRGGYTIIGLHISTSTQRWRPIQEVYNQREIRIIPNMRSERFGLTRTWGQRDSD